MSGRIFINYRRGDEPGFTQALLGRLEQAFPAERLFIDVDNIPPGEDFVKTLEAQVAQCDAMLTVIGHDWLNSRDERGARRLDDPHDFVRLEIESALRQGKRVIPVLVHEARMPHPDELPGAIRALATRNAVRLTHERFRADVEGLIKALDKEIKEGARHSTSATFDRRPRRQKGFKLLRPQIGGAILLVVLAGSGGFWILYKLQKPAAPAPVAEQQAPVQSGEAQSMPPAQSTTATPQILPTKTQNQPQAPSPPPAMQGSEPTDPEEHALWSAIKDEKDVKLFETYLKRYPSGAFANIARSKLTDLNTSTPTTAQSPQTDDTATITDALSINELRDRLYELNFDPGSLDGPITDATREAIREFQRQINVPTTGTPTMGLLRRLRALSSLTPWGAIVYDKGSGKWGMAWDETTRKAAVASARASCGNCATELSFFGNACGVFAHSSSSWAIMTREDLGKAKEAALADCGKRGKSCQVIASVCADGSNRFSAK